MNREKVLETFAQIEDFNRRMSENPSALIELNNKIIKKDEEKHQLIETFTSQLYAYFLKKQEGEYK